MAKISVLFKPSNNSWVSWDLQQVGYYEYNYKDIYDINLRNSKKVKISNCPYECISDLYDYLKQFDWIFIIMITISELFE